MRLDQLAVRRIDNYPGRPTIVFLHDSLGCITLWREFPQHLGELTRCNVIVYDRHGYGQSGPLLMAERDNGYMEREADVLHALLDHWQLDQAILFGHSDGGSIALIAAGKYPVRVAGVVTEGAHIFVEDITLQGIREGIRAYRETNLPEKLAKYHGANTDAMFWAWAGTWTTEAFRSWNIEQFLPAITCPALIIQGDDDEYGTLEQVCRIVEQVSGPAERLVLPGVKHTPHKEVPEQVLGAAARFINESILRGQG